MVDYERIDITYNPQCHDLQAFQKGPIKVLLSNDKFDFFGDGKSKLCKHLSLSCADRNPTWEEIKEARYRFLDRNKDAYQVLPPPDQYVNIHNFTFHVWQPILEV